MSGTPITLDFMALLIQFWITYCFRQRAAFTLLLGLPITPFVPTHLKTYVPDTYCSMNGLSGIAIYFYGMAWHYTTFTSVQTTYPPEQLDLISPNRLP